MSSRAVRRTLEVILLLPHWHLQNASDLVTIRSVDKEKLWSTFMKPTETVQNMCATHQQTSRKRRCGEGEDIANSKSELRSEAQTRKVFADEEDARPPKKLRIKSKVQPVMIPLPDMHFRGERDGNFTKGTSRIVEVRDRSSAVVAILPNPELLQQLRNAAEGERKLRQTQLRAKQQKQQLEAYRSHQSRLAQRALDLSRQHQSPQEPAAKRLMQVYRDLQAKISKVRALDRQVDGNLKYQSEMTKYLQAVAANALEGLFMNCQLMSQPTPLPDPTEFDLEVEQDYVLPDEGLSQDDEIQQLFDKTEERNEEAETDTHDTVMEGDEVVQLDAMHFAQLDARKDYNEACRDHQIAENGLEARREIWATEAQRHQEAVANGLDVTETSESPERRYVKEVQKLTQRVAVAEAARTAARRKGQAAGLQIGFGPFGMDEDYEDDGPPIPPREGFEVLEYPLIKDRYHPLKFHLERPPPKISESFASRDAILDWVRTLPDRNSSTAQRSFDISAQDLAMANKIDAVERMDFRTGVSGIEEISANQVLLKEWKAACEELRAHTGV